MCSLKFLALLALLMCGCSPFTETDAIHILHRGEAGVLEHHRDTWVYGAIDKSRVHELARAVEKENGAELEQLMRSGAVLRLHANTRVRVLEESYNERLVRIEEGPDAGTSVWVPYEWLKSKPAETRPSL